MAAGLPVVGSRAGAVPEVVADGEAGFLVDPLDPDAVAGALLRLLGDAPLRQTMGEGAARTASAFGLEAAARAFLSAVSPLVEGRSGVTVPPP